MFNLHCHSIFCDGSSPLREYADAAISKGFHTLGFSSHAPLPIENKFALRDEQTLLQYAVEVKQLSREYQSQLKIYTALEIDYIPGISDDFDHLRKLASLDYVIGGVHLIRNASQEQLWFIDGPRQEIYVEGLQQIFGGDIQKAVTTYWQQMRDMITTQKPDIVAHLDKIKMHNQNRFFSTTDNWYVEQVEQTLEVIAAAGTIVEVNTRGLYKGRSDELFPGEAILTLMLELNIPVTVSSDSHRPEEIDGFYPQAYETLRRIGYRQVKCFTDKGWEEREF
ncbi:MAG: histidinol-phosphatase [Petrimonas sp.]|nr:histidinol-phosphatase [Petrimonas sp.]